VQAQRSGVVDQHPEDAAMTGMADAAARCRGPVVMNSVMTRLGHGPRGGRR
jgi:hypothetical protein